MLRSRVQDLRLNRFILVSFNVDQTFQKLSLSEPLRVETV